MSATFTLPDPPEINAVADWQQRRSAFVHDWLCNRFMPRLQACVALTGTGAAASARTADGFIAVVQEWPEHGAEALQLIEIFCDVMSPTRQIDEIMPALPAALAQYLRKTALESWKVRHGIPALLDEVRTAHASANRHYAMWALSEMARDCERIAKAFSKLPSRVVL